MGKNKLEQRQGRTQDKYRKYKWGKQIGTKVRQRRTQDIISRNLERDEVHTKHKICCTHKIIY